MHVELCILGYPKNISNEDSDQTADVPADQNIYWVHMPEGTFSDASAQIVIYATLNPFWNIQQQY